MVDDKRGCQDCGSIPLDGMVENPLIVKKVKEEDSRLHNIDRKAWALRKVYQHKWDTDSRNEIWELGSR